MMTRLRIVFGVTALLWTSRATTPANFGADATRFIEAFGVARDHRRAERGVCRTGLQSVAAPGVAGNPPDVLDGAVAAMSAMLITSGPIFSLYDRNAWKSRLRATRMSPRRTDSRWVVLSAKAAESRVRCEKSVDASEAR
jgi:hypothetical protein